MSDAEAKLAAFFREDRPKASDAAFRLAVLERRARRRFYRYSAGVIVGGVLATGYLVVMAPSVPAMSVSQPMTGIVPLLSVAVTGACMLLAFARTRQVF